MASLSFPVRIIQKLTGYESPEKANLSFEVSQRDEENFLVSVYAITENGGNYTQLKNPKRWIDTVRRVNLEGET